MFADKIKSGASGILTYGITPPKSGTTSDRITAIAEKTVARLLALDIDALVVYDVQDESARTAAERPFPFFKALDPFYFASQHLDTLDIPKIIYRPAGKFSPDELADWLEGLRRHRFYPVFVGVPTPDYPVKTSLPDAYQLWRKHEDVSVMGAVTIPERHAILSDEDKRILNKIDCGVSYFISQCIFNVGYAKRVIEDLCNACGERLVQPPTVIFTLAACGSAKTLHFMEWLGIHIPDDLKAELLQSENMLQRSIEVCLNTAKELTAFCSSHCIPFGFNIESVAIRKEEIEASIDMVKKVGDILHRQGVRKTAVPTVSY